MMENSILKSIGLLVIIIGGVFVGTYEVVGFFLQEKKYRKFWLKVWLALSIAIGILFWVIIIFWENKHFK
jgi:phosphate/sulfate permease